MKKLNEMNREELLDYFRKKKLNGATYSSIANIISKNNIDDDTRKWIMGKLGSIDKVQRKKIQEQKKAYKRSVGITNFLIGLAIMVIGIIMYRESAKTGIILIFNIFLWISGGLLMLRGLLTIAATIF